MSTIRDVSRVYMGLRAKEPFQLRAKAQLALYKTKVLGVAEDGMWRKNNLTYPHILPIAQQGLNILPAIRERFWPWFRSRRIRLHSDFHHLNSSQALCFNLFFPFLADDEGSLRLVLDALGVPRESSQGAAFEYQPNETEGTCFDFAIPTPSGGHMLFELKYTESDFGKAPADSAHLNKFRDIYQPRLAGKFDEKYCSAGAFLRNYQILRNVWHLNRGADDVVTFLFPKRNTALRRKEAIIRSCVVEPFQSRVRIYYLEDLVSSLLRSERCSDLQHKTLTEFQSKYLAES